MEERIQEIKELFYKDKLQLAYQKLRTLEAESSSDASMLATLNSIEEFSILKSDLAEADRCLDLLGDLDSWVSVKETENIAVFSKRHENDFIVRAEMLLQQPLFPVLSLCNEIDLLPEWIQVVNSVSIISEVSTFRRLLWYKFNIPWPASNRDMTVNAFGLTIPENNSVMIILRNIDTPTFLGNEIPQPDKGGVRVTLKTGVLNFMKRSENETQVSLIVYSDPHVAMVPETLLNWCTQTGIYYFIKSMEDKTAAFAGSIYERRVQERSGFYQEIMNMLQETFGA